MCAFFWYQERRSAKKKAETQPLLEEVRLDDDVSMNWTNECLFINIYRNHQRSLLRNHWRTWLAEQLEKLFTLELFTKCQLGSFNIDCLTDSEDTLNVKFRLNCCKYKPRVGLTNWSVFLIFTWVFRCCHKMSFVPQFLLKMKRSESFILKGT